MNLDVDAAAMEIWLRGNSEESMAALITRIVSLTVFFFMTCVLLAPTLAGAREIVRFSDGYSAGYYSYLWADTLSVPLSVPLEPLPSVTDTGPE